MKRLPFLSFGWLMLVSSVAAQSEFFGKLEAQLRPDMVHLYQRVYSTPTGKESPKFVPPLEKGSAVSIGELIDQRLASGKSQAILVEFESSPTFVSIDLDSNGIVDDKERFQLSPGADRPNDLVNILQLPIKHSGRKLVTSRSF